MNKYANPVVNPTTADLHLQWDIPYEPGVIKAVGKINGKIVCSEEILTAGEPFAVRLSADCDTIDVDERGVSNVKVEIVDSVGNVIPTADNLIQFSIEGEGKIIGVDNGNPLDYDSYQASQRKAYNGMCLAIIQSLRKEGNIKLVAKSQGLKEAIISIAVKGKMLSAH